MLQQPHADQVDDSLSRARHGRLVGNTAIAIAFYEVQVCTLNTDCILSPYSQFPVNLSVLIVASFLLSSMYRSRRTIPLPEGLPVGQLIGKRGSNIRHLQFKSGSRIAVNGDAGFVTVTGSASDITAAVNLLQAQFASWRSSGIACFPPLCALSTATL